MEDTVKYGKNPIPVVKKAYSLANQEEIKISVNVRKEDSSGVEEALIALGRWFLEHSDKTGLAVTNTIASGFSNS